MRTEISVTGIITDHFQFHHTDHTEATYSCTMCMGKASLTLLIPEHLADITRSLKGSTVSIHGERYGVNYFRVFALDAKIPAIAA